MLSCGKFRKLRLAYSTKFSLPINGREDSLKILNTSDFFFDAPSSYYIKSKNLYIIDKFNNRILQYNKRNKMVLKITNEQKNDINLVFFGSNQVLQPFTLNNDLFSFRDLGNIFVNDEYIYCESVLMKKGKEHPINAFSIILKYNLKGEPVNVIGLKKGQNKIYPFSNLIKFSVDKKQNMFIYSKQDENWQVLKLDSNFNIIYKFRSYDLLQNYDFKKKEKEKIVIENIDNSINGDFLLIACTYFKNEIEFQKMIFYRIDIATGKVIKLFKVSDENFNFVLLDNSNLVYLWASESLRNNKEGITIRIFNLAGKIIANYYIKLNRSEAQWFDIKMQKDRLISGINIAGNKFNVVEWK